MMRWYGRVSSGDVSDRSFIRFGGLAGILLAISSWASVVVYYTIAASGRDLVGLETFRLLYALAAVWALFGIVAVHWVVRANGGAWSFFAALVGVVASAGTMSASLYQVAGLRAALLDPGLHPPAASPTDPLYVMSFALTGLWFVIADLLLWRARFPRWLVALGFVSAADLFAGFFGALSAQEAVVAMAAIGAGAVGGPLYWVWLGVLLRRRADGTAPGPS